MADPFLSALAGFVSGTAEGQDKKRALARQTTLDNQAKAEKDREFGLRRSEASNQQARTIGELGLEPDQPDTPPLQTAMMESGPFGALLHSFDRTQAKPANRISLLSPDGSTQTFRQGTPQAERLLREREALDADRQQGLDAQKAKEAARLRAQGVTDAAAREQADNEEAYGTFKAAFPKNQFSALPYNPKMKYKPLMDLLGKQADRQTQIDAAKALQASKPISGGGGGMGAGGIGGLARTSSAVKELGLSDDQMHPFEEAVRAGKANYSGLDYWKKNEATMYDNHGIVNPAVQAAVYANLDKTNPDLANYLRAAENWALADSQISGRASDFRVKLDGFVSQIGPNAKPAQIDNTWAIRSTRRQELEQFLPAMEAMGTRIAGQGGRATGSGGPKSATFKDPVTGKVYTVPQP